MFCVTVVLYAVTGYIGPYYNDTWRYCLSAISYCIILSVAVKVIPMYLCISLHCINLKISDIMECEILRPKCTSNLHYMSLCLAFNCEFFPKFYKLHCLQSSCPSLSRQVTYLKWVRPHTRDKNTRPRQLWDTFWKNDHLYASVNIDVTYIKLWTDS